MVYYVAGPMMLDVSVMEKDVTCGLWQALWENQIEGQLYATFSEETAPDMLLDPGKHP